MTATIYRTERGTLDVFTTAYIECALWSSTDGNEDRPLDECYDVGDIAPETLARMVKDCATFQAEQWERIKGDVTRAGHDFWLTRNGHGAGFWDGYWPADGDALTAASKAFGECDLYIGDDGRAYL